MTASKYVLSALFAWLILQEHISATRWFGTLIVAFGVLLVGVSERNGNGAPKENPPKKHFSSVVLLAPTSLSVLLSKTSVAIVGLALIESIGDMLFAAGMKQVGEVATLQLNTLLRLARRAVVNPLLGLGALSMAATFLLTLALLSWADLSLVMPMTALSYPFSVLGARWFLSETVNTARLVGTGFICLGVALISLNATGL
jgi:drug/metabolite transporter (DMT)-like permease